MTIPWFPDFVIQFRYRDYGRSGTNLSYRYRWTLPPFTPAAAPGWHVRTPQRRRTVASDLHQKNPVTTFHIFSYILVPLSQKKKRVKRSKCFARQLNKHK